MVEKYKKGKRQLIALLIIAMSLQVLILANYVIYVGTENVGPRVLRAIIVGMLCIFTYYKYKAAKWLLVGWYVFNLATAITNPSFSSSYLLWLLFGTYSAIPLALLFAPNISFYLASRNLN